MASYDEIKTGDYVHFEYPFCRSSTPPGIHKVRHVSEDGVLFSGDICGGMKWPFIRIPFKHCYAVSKTYDGEPREVIHGEGFNFRSKNSTYRANEIKRHAPVGCIIRDKNGQHHHVTEIARTYASGYSGLTIDEIDVIYCDAIILEGRTINYKGKKHKISGVGTKKFSTIDDIFIDFKDFIDDFLKTGGSGVNKYEVKEINGNANMENIFSKVEGFPVMPGYIANSQKFYQVV